VKKRVVIDAIDKISKRGNSRRNELAAFPIRLRSGTNDSARPRDVLLITNSGKWVRKRCEFHPLFPPRTSMSSCRLRDGFSLQRRENIRLSVHPTFFNARFISRPRHEYTDFRITASRFFFFSFTNATPRISA